MINANIMQLSCRFVFINNSRFQHCHVFKLPVSCRPEYCLITSANCRHSSRRSRSLHWLLRRLSSCRISWTNSFRRTLTISHRLHSSHKSSRLYRRQKHLLAARWWHVCRTRPHHRARRKLLLSHRLHRLGRDCCLTLSWVTRSMHIY